MTTDVELEAAMASFHAEAQELLQQMEDCLLRLESDADDSDELNALFRTVHTIKGSAGMFGLSGVVRFTHDVETVLDLLREGALVLDARLSALLLGCRDHVLALLGDDPPNVDAADALQRHGEALTAQLQALLRPHVATAHAAPPDAAPAHGSDGAPLFLYRIRATFGNDTFRAGFDPLSVLAHVAAQGEVLALRTTVSAAESFEAHDPETCRIGFDLEMASTRASEQIEAAFKFVGDDCTLQIDVSLAPAEAPVAAPAAVAAPALVANSAPVVLPIGDAVRSRAGAPRLDDARMVRIPAEKLDQLIDLVGELVIAGSSNAAAARRHGIKDVIGTAAQINGLVESIRDRALSLRMVPVGDTFTRFRRIVRELGAKLGKQVELVLRGTDAELDKSVLERLNDPLVHIVRNALDHGVEAPAQRVAAGKPAQATLVLEAQHEAGGIVINVRDDGAGLDRGRILRKAIERGIVAADAAPSDDEIAELIFAPGFSTSDAVTDLSGRGVGMDVVRSVITELRGSVRVLSPPGAGTTVQMRLPLTLAIIAGFHVRAGDHQFVLPMDCVVECVGARQTAAPPAGAFTSTIALRGQPLPVLHLRELYALDGPRAELPSIVVVRSGELRIGLVFDALMGEAQTVIKPLSDVLRHLDGIAGSSVLGNGDVALILDAPALAGLAVAEERRRAADPPRHRTAFANDERPSHEPRVRGPAPARTASL